MSLRAKTLFFIAVLFTLFLVFLHIASDRIVLDSFLKLEAADARVNVQRVLSALQDDITDLNALTRNWSGWDDTYTFIQDQNSAYIDSNLGPESSSTINNRWGFMLYLDSDGKVVYEKGTDLATQQPISVPDELKRRLVAGDLLLKRPDTEFSVAGLLLLADSPLLVASQPILTSAQTGPIRGSLICARYLNAKEIERLSRTTLFSLTVHRLNDPKIPDDFHQALGLLSEGQPIVVYPVSETMTAGYALLKDIYGKAAFVLKAKMPRTLYTEGRASLRRFDLLRLVIWGVYLFVTLGMLEFLVLRRIASLSRNLRRLEVQRQPSARIAVDSKDELGSLAESINSALAAIEKAERQQVEQQQRHRILVTQARESIALVDAKTMRFVEVNPAFSRLLGYSAEEAFSLILHDVAVATLSFVDLIDRLRKEQGSIVAEQQYRCKDGRLIDVEVSTALMSSEGRELLCLMVHDITERKKKSEELKRHNEELTKLNEIMMGREERILELKQEVNSLLQKLGQLPCYSL